MDQLDMYGCGPMVHTTYRQYDETRKWVRSKLELKSEALESKWFEISKSKTEDIDYRL